MDPAQWERIKALYYRAIDLPEAEREQLLAETAASEPETVAEVRSLLGRRPRTEFLEPPTNVAPAVDKGAEPEVGGRGRIVGDFELLERIGGGGMGVVWRARQRSLDRLVAVKILRHVTASERDIDRFGREPRAVARLRHPGIVQVIAVGETEELHWFAMELVEGIDLAKVIASLRQAAATDANELPIPRHRAPGYFAAVARIVAEAADALQHAHANDIVHRDVKPSNLILDRDGHVRVLDFGIARDAELGTITAPGEMPGSLYYMSPEQIRAVKHAVDHRTDIYSLGVVLYELLTLRRPFYGSTDRDIMAQIADREPREVSTVEPSVPRDLAIICHAAMRKNPAARYAAAGRLRDDLRRFLDHNAIEAKPPSFKDRIARVARRHRAALTAAGVLAVGLSTGVACAQHRAANERIDALRSPLVDLLREADWDPLPVSRLEEGRRCIGELRALDPDASTSRMLDDATRRYDALNRRWKDDGLAIVKLGLGEGAAPDGSRVVDDAVVLDGIFKLHAAADLFPEDRQIHGLLTKEMFYPRLSVSARLEGGAAATGVVAVRPIEWRTGIPGEREVLGALPIEERPLRPGYYRILIELPDGGFREYARYLDRDHRAHRVDAVVRPVRAENLVRVGAATIAIPRAGPNSLCPNLERPVTIAAFEIADAETSIGEYREFLAATGRRPPADWELFPQPPSPEVDALPATGMSWFDAQAYAEWRGLRLATHPEWELAARGPNMNLYPWGAEPDTGRNRANVHHGLEPTPTGADRIRAFLACMEPVRGRPEGRTDAGLYHLLGNAAEFTESIHAEREGGVLMVRWDKRIVMGSFARAGGLGTQTLDIHANHEADLAYATSRIGFRCARSIAP